jgi:hypothetical protein
MTRDDTRARLNLVKPRLSWYGSTSARLSAAALAPALKHATGGDSFSQTRNYPPTLFSSYCQVFATDLQHNRWRRRGAPHLK